VFGSGEGRSKKEAEQQAAEAAWRAISNGQGDVGAGRAEAGVATEAAAGPGAAGPGADGHANHAEDSSGE
jgi:ribonuclease-3